MPVFAWRAVAGKGADVTGEGAERSLYGTAGRVIYPSAVRTRDPRVRKGRALTQLSFEQRDRILGGGEAVKANFEL